MIDWLIFYNTSTLLGLFKLRGSGIAYILFTFIFLYKVLKQKQEYSSIIIDDIIIKKD